MRKLKPRDIKCLSQNPQLGQNCQGHVLTRTLQYLAIVLKTYCVSPFLIPTSSQVLPGNSCFSEDGNTWLTLSWPHPLDPKLSPVLGWMVGLTPPALLDTRVWAPPEKTSSITLNKVLR